MKSSTILTVVVRLLLPTVIVFSLYLLLSGHNAPGGGFVGGLVAGAAVVLLYAAGGVDLMRRVLQIPAEVFLGVGLLFAQVTAIVPWLFGMQVLESRVFDLHLPVFGEIHLASPLFFDIGVYLVVVGLVAKTLETLGAEEPPQRGGSPQKAPSDSPTGVTG